MTSLPGSQPRTAGSLDSNAALKIGPPKGVKDRYIAPVRTRLRASTETVPLHAGASYSHLRLAAQAEDVPWMSCYDLTCRD